MTNDLPIPPFSDRLIAWQKRFGRHDLPWQQSRDPYRVWLSEIMLQQTQVATVLPYYQRFLARFPELPTLAAAPVEDVMAHWSGLGYYARARNLHACAKWLMANHAGNFPREAAAIAALPGIGRSTANAIAVFCFDACLPILDGNVKRLLCRHAGIEGWSGTPAVTRELWQHATMLLPKEAVASYIQGQMDLGATVCTRSRPRCAICPVAADCNAHHTGRTGQLPTAKPRKTLPERETRMLMLFADDRILLLPRPPAGIWGGLLSLPELPAESSVDAEVSRLGYALLSERGLTSMVHGFTHFRLHIHPLLCAIRPLPRAAESNARWLTEPDLEDAPLPAPIRKLLLAAFAELRRLTKTPDDKKS